MQQREGLLCFILQHHNPILIMIATLANVCIGHRLCAVSHSITGLLPSVATSLTTIAVIAILSC